MSFSRVLLVGPARGPDYPDWNRIPFRRSAFLGFFATNTIAVSLFRSRPRLRFARAPPSVLLARSSGNEGTFAEKSVGEEKRLAIHEGAKTIGVEE